MNASFGSRLASHEEARPQPEKRKHRSGFSLVEVTLAIGLVAFAFVALLGLLPIGWTVFKNGMETSVRSQIFQRVVTDAQQTDFSVLASQPEQLRYFDNEGVEVSGTLQGQSVYTVRLRVNPSTVLPNAATSANLLTLQVDVAKDPAHAKDPFKNGTNRTYPAYVSRNR